MDFSVGQKIKMKKPHPCGENCWEILRVGMDFKMQSSGNGTSKNRREKFSWIFVNFSCNCLPSVL